mgnify:CR=1 FL=1
MKNYKNLAENYLKEFEGKANFDFRLGVRGFAFELASLPDQEPKDVPEVSRKAFTCRHDFKIFDELDEESIAVYCNKCGTTIDGAKLMLPAVYASGQEPKCEKCGNPFEYHHHKHITREGWFHTGCYNPQEPKECKHLNAAGYRWTNDNCLNCGADLTGKQSQPKNHPKLPEKLDEREYDHIVDRQDCEVTEICKTINQILDYLKNNYEL